MSRTPSIEIYLGGSSKDDELLRRIYASLVSSGRGRAQSFFRMALIRGVHEMRDLWPDDIDEATIPRNRRQKKSRNSVKPSTTPKRESESDTVSTEVIEETVAEQQVSEGQETSTDDVANSDEDDFVFVPKFEEKGTEEEKDAFQNIRGLM